MANRSDGGLGMVGRSGCGSTRSHSTSSGQAPSAGSGQVLRGRRDVVRLGPPKTAGRLTMNGKGMGLEGREAGGVRLGMCSGGRVNVFSFGADVSSFRANVSSFWPNVFSFEGDVSTLAGDVSSFRRGGLVGDGARTEGEIPRLRCAALGTTTAAGDGSGPGMAGAGNDVNAGNAISGCGAGSAGNAGRDGGEAAVRRWPSLRIGLRLVRGLFGWPFPACRVGSRVCGGCGGPGGGGWRGRFRGGSSRW